ncbi:RraA family protein [Litorivicinus lipolyticus]|uniref:RraA family protein n=1 Tax=Litorivicinus lipolyticus TaxID=418701 RepID=UPI003B5B380D
MNGDAEWLKVLASFDTPSVCNAIEVVQGRRGFSGFTREPLRCVNLAQKSLVGFARTAVIQSAVPATESVEVIRRRRLDYFRYMADGPRPAIAVIQDLDSGGSLGAWWGEVNSYAHQNTCQLSGALTNGSVRDLDDLAPGFGILASTTSPSHGFVHVKSFDDAVTVFGLRVEPNDLIHADQHGALVVPAEVLPALGAALRTLVASESIVLDPLKAGPVSIDQFERLWAAFEAART